jgi:hypothetical protein
MKKKLTIVFVNIAIFIFLLLFLEILVRILVPEIGTPGMDKRILRDSVYFSSRGMIPDASGVNYGFTFRTDKNGFSRYAKSKTNGKRVLYLGDSVTMGIGVREDSTFAGIVHNTSDIIVLNPALIGYARQDYLNIIRKLIVEQGNALKISRVYLFWCLNDIYNFYPENITPEVKPTGILGTAFSFFKNNFKLFYFIKNTFTDRPKSYYLYDEKFYNPGNKLFIESISDIVQIAGILKKADIPFKVFLLPYEYQLREGINKPQRLLGDSLKSRGLRVNDLTPYFAKHGNSKDLYLYGDGIHFSEKGHRLVAEYLKSEEF